MSGLKLLANNYNPVNAGEATEKPVNFTDVVSSGFQNTRDNFNMNSSSRLIAEIEEENNELYKNLTGSYFTPTDDELDIPKIGTREAFMEAIKYEDFREFTTQKGLKFDKTIEKLKLQDPQKYGGLKTKAEIREEAKRRANMTTDEFENVLSRAEEDSAFYGSIIGSIGGALTDPFNLATMPLGIARGAGILKTVLGEAAIQAGVEAVSQPYVAKWQKELGREYNLGDMTENVFYAAIAGGAFAGVAKGLEKSASVTFALMKDSDKFNAAQKQAADYMSRYAQVKEANPNPKVVNELHSDTVEAVNKAVKDGQSPADISLPMTARQFNEIDTENTRGLNPQQKNTLNEVKKFQAGFSSLRLFHGTKQKFDEFSLSNFGKTDEGFAGKGIYFTDAPDIAAQYAKGDEGRLIEASVSIKKPLIVRDYPEINEVAGLPKGRRVDDLNFSEKLTDAIKAKGYDGIIVRDFDKKLNRIVNEYVAFDESQVIIRGVSDPRKAKPEFEPLFVEEYGSGYASRMSPVSTIESEAPTLNVTQAQELSARLDSEEFTRSIDTSFKQMVDADPDKIIELEEGQIRLGDLNKQLEDEQNFLNEITTCAIG